MLTNYANKKNIKKVLATPNTITKNQNIKGLKNCNFPNEYFLLYSGLQRKEKLHENKSLQSHERKSRLTARGMFSDTCF